MGEISSLDQLSLIMNRWSCQQDVTASALYLREEAARCHRGLAVRLSNGGEGLLVDEDVSFELWSFSGRLANKNSIQLLQDSL